ncbi:MAG TPA: low affinity iron permease family protein [Burkholderiales bacterium]|nr:low affinity iron permease family protein [Burkholderiales bacterium]
MNAGFEDVQPGTVKTVRFSRFARRLAALAGRPGTFFAACLCIVLWALSGPLFGYSDTWQLIINTSTTIITFLMVFVIQNTQNRDTAAIQIKLDELIRATQGAHNAILDLEHLEEEELEAYLKRYEGLAAAARERLRAGRIDTGAPDLKPEGAAPRDA